MDLGVVTVNSRSLNASSGPRAASAVKVFSAGVGLLGGHGVAEGFAAALARRDLFGGDGVKHLVAASAAFLVPARIANHHLDDRQWSPGLGQLAHMWKAGAKAIIVWKPT